MESKIPLKPLPPLALPTPGKTTLERCIEPGCTGYRAPGKTRCQRCTSTRENERQKRKRKEAKAQKAADAERIKQLEQRIINASLPLPQSGGSSNTELAIIKQQLRDIMQEQLALRQYIAETVEANKLRLTNLESTMKAAPNSEKSDSDSDE